jgi:MoaA/NifB/PqqE/SkfB family radical SAM enzyme
MKEANSVQRILATGDQVSPRRDVLSVLWAITKACTFSCSYCVYYKSPRNAEYSTRADLIEAARKLVRLARPGYQITLYGGEPTLHPNFIDLLEYFSQCGAPVSLRVYTNGNSPFAVYEQMAQAIGTMPFGVIFSLHLEFVNFPKFMKALQVTAQAGVAVGVGLMFTATHSAKAMKYIEELLELRKSVPFVVSITHPYSVDGVMGKGCSHEDLERLAEAQQTFDAFAQPEGFSSPFFTRVACQMTVDAGTSQKVLGEEESLRFLRELARPSFTGMYCCSGANVMFIEEDGAVRGGVCSSSRSLGNILTDSELSLLQRADPIQCTSSACTSLENIPLPKFAEEAEAMRVSSEFKRRAKSYFYLAEASRLA